MTRFRTIVFCLTVFFTLPMHPNGLSSEGRMSKQPSAATLTWPGSLYIATDDSNLIEAPKVTHFRINSSGMEVWWFGTEITWDPATLLLAAVHGSAFLIDSIGVDSSTLRQGPGYIVLSYRLAEGVQLLGSENLIDFTWQTPCQAQGSSTVLEIDLFSQHNLMTDGTVAYRADSATLGHVKVGAIGEGYLQGDLNADSFLSVTDIIYLVNYIFRSAPPVLTIVECTDLNGDCTPNAGDIIHLVNHVFKSGPGPYASCSN